MKTYYTKIILLLLIVSSSFNILSIYTDIRIDNLLPTLNANVSYQYNEEEFLELLHPFTSTKILIEYGTDIRLNKKIFKTYKFQKYSAEEKAIYLLNKKNDIEKHYIKNLQHISFRMNSIEHNHLGKTIGGVAGGVLAVWPSAFMGFLITIGLSDILGVDSHLGGENSAIMTGTCLAITGIGIGYGAKLGMDIGGNMGNPYIHIKMSGKNGWVISQ